MVDADVGNSTRTEWFGKKYPDRFFNIGIAESNLVGRRRRAGVLGQDQRDRQLRGVHHLQRLRPAPDVGRLSRARTSRSSAATRASRSARTAPRRWGSKTSRWPARCPGFVVIVPADEESAKAATAAMLEYKGPVYLRVGRPEVPQHLHRRLGPVRRSARPTGCAMGPT